MRNEDSGVERRAILGITDDIAKSGDTRKRRELVMTEIELSRDYREFAMAYLDREYFKKAS